MRLRAARGEFWAALIASLLFATTACVSNSSADSGAAQRDKDLESFTALRQQRQAELGAMDVEQLAGELAKDSEKGVEPFNSMPFAEMVSRGREAAVALESQLVAHDRSSFLGLLALRAVDAATYAGLKPAFRVAVLVDDLRESTYFNAWGLPHLYWEDAGKALIDEGRTAVEPLTALLTDSRPAPMWGEEEVVEYQRYEYRVKDYAWALLRAISGHAGAIPVDASTRDTMINELIGAQS